MLYEIFVVYVWRFYFSSLHSISRLFGQLEMQSTKFERFNAYEEKYSSVQIKSWFSCIDSHAKLTIALLLFCGNVIGDRIAYPDTMSASAVLVKGNIELVELTYSTSTRSI